MTTARALTIVEIDTDLYRATQYETDRVGEAIKGWSRQWNQNNTFIKVEDEDFPTGWAAEITPTSGNRHAFVYDVFPDSLSVSLLGLFKVDTSFSNSGAALVARAAGTSNLDATGYRLILGAATIEIQRTNAGTTTVIATESYTPVLGTLYWMRFDVVDDDGAAFLRGKVWADGEEEPAEFMISVSDDLTTYTFPPITSTTATQFNTETTSHNVPMPATVAAGDLLIMQVGFGNPPDNFLPITIATPTGWTSLVDREIYPYGRFRVFAKLAAGTEGGTTVNVVTAEPFGLGACSGGAQVHRILAANWAGGSVEDGCEAGGIIATSAPDMNPDPSSFSPSWGNTQNLWIAVCGWFRSGTGASAYPSGYSSGTNTNDTLNNCGTASAILQSATGTQDPGTFTLNSGTPTTNGWVAAVIAVKPMSAAATSLAAGSVGVAMNVTDPTRFGFFRARSLLGENSMTHRFAEADKRLPITFNAIPSIRGVNDNQAVISLGEDLGKRSSITVDFDDHRWGEDGEFFNDGTYWGRFRTRELFQRNRELRLLRGYTHQPLSSFSTYTYFLDKFDGPTPRDGKFSITAQDPLKFADNDRAQAPVLSNGRLLGALDAVVTSATLGPGGIGNSEYPAYGKVCIGGKEVCSFTRSGDILTITRGQNNTTAIAHEADERVQLCIDYSGNDVAEIIYDLLLNYAAVPVAYLPLALWQIETAAFLDVIYARVITEPTAVKKLLQQLIENAALALWWDPESKLIQLKVIRPIGIDATPITESQILHGSFQVKEQFDKRKSQVWASYGQRNPADRGDNEDNYRNSLAVVDLESELIFGTQEIKKITAPWIQTETAAERLTQLYISRFRRPPRNFRFNVAPDFPITLGAGYRLPWRQNQQENGRTIMPGAPIQVTRKTIEEGKILIEAEEMLASGEIVLTNTLIFTDTSTGLTWTVPDTWNNSDNSIHCIAGGGGGGRASTGDSNGGGGGGGGAYSRVENVALTPGASIAYRVGIAGEGSKSANGNVATAGGDTFIGSTGISGSFCAAIGGARGENDADYGTGDNSLGGQGGQASSGIGDFKSSGGDGGEGHNSGDNAGGAGGGGAGGPDGDGGDGGGEPGSGGEDGGAGGGAGNGGEDGNPSVDGDGGQGGNNRFNFGGGTATTAAREGGGGGGGGDNDPAETAADAGQPGGDGEQLWTQTIAPIISAGPGGGGGGGATATGGRGGSGGLYGGGGGGSGSSGSIFVGNGGDGAQGCIVIVWREAEE